MTEPAAAGDLPTIDQARAIAAANDTRVVRRWYTRGLPHRTTPHGSCEAGTGSTRKRSFPDD